MANWVEQQGGLPHYIKRIERHLRAQGMSESHAIAVAVSAAKRMCASGDLNFPGVQHVNPGSRAEACAAVARWEAMKAAAHADGRNLMADHEQRTIDVDISNVRTDGNTLKGHAAVFNVLSEDLGGFRERIAPGAFAGVLDSDVRLLVNHKPDHVLARTKSGTLRLAEDDTGLAVEADMPNTSYARDLRESLRRGDLDGMSFRFDIAEEDWSADDGGEIRTVRRVARLQDVCLATYPAYPTASVELRTRPERGSEVRTEDRGSGGGLAVEERTAPKASPEQRVMDAIRSVPKGEARDLTTADASAGPVTPPELSTYLWDLLRDSAVVLQSGARVIATDRKSIKWPRLVGDIVADFYDELEEIDESDPDFDDFEIEPKAIKALVRGSSEAFEDSDPDLLRIVQSNLQTSLSLKLDRELLVGNAAKGFKGLTNVTGTTTLDAAGVMTNYDALLRAVGVLAGQHVPGGYVAVAHPWTATHLSLLKKQTDNEEALMRPEGAPPMFLTTQIGRNSVAGTSTIVVYAPSQVAVVRRRDVTVEVDRSQEFSKDAVLVRGKIRATLFLPYPQAVVKIVNVPAPDPAV